MTSPRAAVLLVALIIIGLRCTKVAAQQSTPDTTATDAILDQSRQANVLTTPGAPSFHAVLDITSAKPDELTPAKPDNLAHQGSIDLLWADPKHYRLEIKSPSFHQLLIVADQSVQESDDGDFYPTWLQNFVNVLLNPLALADGIQGHNDSPDNARFADLCVVRDGRRNNVLDATAFARICFNKSRNMQLDQALDFTHSVIFSHFEPFHDKSIARLYNSSTRDGVDLYGRLGTLEDWEPDPSILVITAATPPSARIVTTFVPSSMANSMALSAPHDIHWPTVRGGAIDGNMVLHVVTDRTGRVREAAPYESDSEELKGYGREVALQYQFKPLLVEGTAVQMETPLIIHFKTTIANAIPEVDDAWIRDNVHCKLPTTVNVPAKAGQQMEITLQVRANGKVGGVQAPDPKLAASLLGGSCTFPTIMQNGQPSQYVAHLNVIAH